jgi:hypothetical protein
MLAKRRLEGGDLLGLLIDGRFDALELPGLVDGSTQQDDLTQSQHGLYAPAN